MKLLGVRDALRLSHAETSRLHRKYGNPAMVDVLRLIGMDRLFVKGEGSWLTDEKGNRCLDFTGAFGANVFGHDTAVIREAVESVWERPNLLQAALSSLEAVLKHNLAAISPGGKLTRSFICSSGAEAVEGAIKLARIYTKRHKIVYAEKGFHGKTMGALSVTGKPAYQKPFWPLIPGTIQVSYDDVEAIRHALRKRDVAAVILEPVQGEGGVRVPSPGYLARVKAICEEYGTLLILDEVQTGFGRTGRMFACEHENVVPDIMCVAKALGGGVEAVAAFMTTDKIMSVYWRLDSFALHTSTMGGRARACAAAIATIERIVALGLSRVAKEKGDRLMKGLQAIQDKYPRVVSDVRGEGLLIGIELRDQLALAVDAVMHDTGSQLLGSLIAGQLLAEEKVLTVYTLNQPRVLRVEPALTVSDEEIDFFLAALDRVLSQYKGFWHLVKNNLAKPARLLLAYKLMTGTVDCA